MTAFVIGVPIAATFLLFIWTRSQELLSYYNIQNVRARSLDEAKRCDGYWRGKRGHEFTLDEKRRA